ncbi:MAG TPA: MauE/DoxX family redox-associated membrane protein [Chthoniobacterales bacterium]
MTSARRWRWGFAVRLLFAILVGAVFLYAGITKVSAPMKFASDISNYQILPWSLGVRFAFYLPWLEIAVGLALIFQRLFLGALALAIALMLVFLGATIWARLQGINIACGCFGTASSNLTLTWHLVIDIGLFVALLGLALAQKGRRASDR